MTAISAPNISMDQSLPDESPPDLANRLTMSAPVRMWGPVLSFFLSLCSFGLLPLLIWPKRWNAFVEFEREQLTSFAAWWRRRASTDQIQSLDAAIEQLAPQSFFTVVPILILVFVGIMMLTLATDGRTMNDILDVTFSYHRSMRWMPRPIEPPVHTIWITSLLVGYVCHWMAVRSHLHAVNSFAKVINQIAAPSRIKPIAPVTCGLNFMWVFVAILLCGSSAWWGIPLIAGGAMQRRYVRRTSPQLRFALAGQLRECIATPGTIKPLPEFCVTPRCGARLRSNAKFCSRCGASI